MTHAGLANWIFWHKACHQPIRLGGAPPQFGSAQRDWPNLLFTYTKIWLQQRCHLALPINWLIFSILMGDRWRTPYLSGEIFFQQKLALLFCSWYRIGKLNLVTQGISTQDWEKLPPFSHPLPPQFCSTQPDWPNLLFTHTKIWLQQWCHLALPINWPFFSILMGDRWRTPYLSGE